MKSYTTGRNLFGTWSKNTVATNLAFGDQLANDEYRHLCSLKDWPFLERTRTLLTDSSNQFLALPYDTDQVREINVAISNITYTPKLSPSATHWDELNLVVFTSDIPEWYFVRAGQIGLWPKPATSSNTMTITQKTRVIDLSVADTTNLTVTTATNGSTSITTSSGLTTMMAGMWIRITYTGGATGTGDGVWYEIASVTNATTLVLVRKYGGTSITAGTAASTIAQMPLLPEPFHDTPWKYAAANYWATNKDARSKYYQDLYDRDVKELSMNWSSPTTDMVIDDGRDFSIINPNLTVRL